MTAGHDVELPALDGLEPVGFLAALGTLRLLQHCGVNARLSFDSTTAVARLAGVGGIAEAVDRIAALIDALPDDGLMVGMPPALIPKKTESSGPDPSRFSRQKFAQAAALATDAAARSWIRALWTDLAVSRGTGSGSDSNEERCEITPFSAPSGQMTLRSMFEKPAAMVRRAPRQRIEEALFSWRRVDGVTGENLDRRAVREAAEQPDGKATKMGVPGATWLALSAIPFFPMGGDGRRPRTLRWARLRFADGRRRLTFSWPVWRHPLQVDAVRALLGHSALDRAAELAAGGVSRDDAVRDQLIALGVERVVIARRWVPPGWNSAGVLVPAGSWG